MKKYALLILCLLAFSVTHAESFRKKDTIQRIGSIESRSDGDYIILNGFTSAGSCPTSSGLVIARFRSGEAGARTFSIALAAKMSGKQVWLTVNDSNKNSAGECFVNSIEIAD